MFIKNIKLYILTYLIISSFFNVCEASNKIIKKVDELMNPDAKVKTILIYENEGEIKEKYEIFYFTKDNNQKVIVRFAAPARQIGNDIIMIDKNVWMYQKKAGRILKIPSNLSFGSTGFCYGDIVRLNMSENYLCEIITEDNDKWLLNLKAKERNAPYFRIELSVKKEGYIPIKGICFSRNNKIIKEIKYEGIKKINNKLKPTLIIVISHYDEGNRSVLRIEEEILKKYPDIIFNKRNLALRLEEKF